jgi:hypothetical protein
MSGLADSAGGWLAVAFFGGVVYLCVVGGEETWRRYSSHPAPTHPVQVQVQAPVKKSRVCATDHRFTDPVGLPYSIRGNVALDGCTGRLCKTWSWEMKVGHSPYQDLPLCSDLPNEIIDYSKDPLGHGFGNR